MRYGRQLSRCCVAALTQALYCGGLSDQCSRPGSQIDGLECYLRLATAQEVSTKRACSSSVGFFRGRLVDFHRFESKLKRPAGSYLRYLVGTWNGFEPGNFNCLSGRPLEKLVVTVPNRDVVGPATASDEETDLYVTLYLIQPRTPGIFGHHRVHRVAVRVVAGRVEIDAVERQDSPLCERASTCQADEENRYEPNHFRH